MKRLIQLFLTLFIVHSFYLLQAQNNNLGVKKKLDFIGRKAAASPATGYANRHAKQQKEILDIVFK